MFFVLGGTLGIGLLILGLRFGAFEVNLRVFLWLCGRTLDLFSILLERIDKGLIKDRQRKFEMDAFSMTCRFLLENAEVRFDCAGARGIEVQATTLLALCLLFWSCFFTSFCNIFWIPLGAQIRNPF